MANTVLKFRDQAIRINYHDLAEVLAMLNQRLETASLVRKVTEPWLSHIQEDLGYVLFDTNLLDGPGVISDFEMAHSPSSLRICERVMFLLTHRVGRTCQTIFASNRPTYSACRQFSGICGARYCFQDEIGAHPIGSVCQN